MVKACICTIGDELLIGQVVDTNSSMIARALQDAGIEVRTMLTIPDSKERIVSSLSEILSSHDLVITTGGLGPTKDDITKKALAELFGAKGMKRDEGQLTMVREILHSRGLDVLEENLAQADVPDCCTVIVNRRGTAPIMTFTLDGAVLYAMPGVPHETQAALPDVIQDIKRRFSLSGIYHKNIMVYGLAESALSHKISAWEDALPKDIHLAYLPNTLTGVKLRLSVYSEDRQQSERRVEEQLNALRPLLGEDLYSEDGQTPEQVIGSLLRGSGKTLSTAESCTGGMIAHMLTTVPGSSEYFLGGVVSYAIEIKEKLLGVPGTTIEQKGVVSSEVAEAMAEGARRVTGSDYAVSTTGLAGPGGDGTNPEGCVWIGVSGPNGTESKRFVFHNDRQRNIERFTATALDLLRRYIVRYR